jgi:hypothetical protein
MNFQITITKQGDRYLAGIPGAYQASATTPLQAMRKWIHAAGIYVQRYKHLEITLGELAQKLGITEAEALDMVEVETLLPPAETVCRGTPADLN